MIGAKKNEHEINNNDYEIIHYLIQQGLINPNRVRYLVEDAINRLGLDLTDLVVFTEAASKNYVVTPIIAAMAGAKVYAITHDSKYGAAKDIENYTYEFAEFCEVRDKINVVFDKTKEIILQANIVTNLGFVRPIDKTFINMMTQNAVIPYMSEGWEYRQEDVDLDACRAKDILVLATNEDAPGLEVFDFVGPLCLKMLFELEIEAYKSKIVIFSNDRFGKVINNFLQSLSANVYLINDLNPEKNFKYLKDCDALIIADYKNNETIIGQNGLITAEELIKLSKGISLIQYAGDVDIDELDRYDIPYFPSHRIGKHRMGITLADLGPKPVIDLHCGGLKVGEIMVRLRQEGYSPEEAKIEALKNPLCQELSL